MSQAPGKSKKPRGERTSREPRQERGERTRLRVLEAVLRVLAARGVGALTYRAVAEEASVALGVTTYYFPSRRELLAAAFRLHLDQVRDRSQAFEAAARAGADREQGAPSVDEMTEGIVGFLATMIGEDRDSTVASHELSLALTRDADLAREVVAATRTHRANTAGLVSRMSASTAEEDAAIWSAVMDALALGWMARPDDPETQDRVRRIVRRLVEKLA